MKTSRLLLLPVAFGLLAVSSLHAQSIFGAWTYGTTDAPTANGTGVFVLLSNGVYFHAASENTADPGGGMNGMERGTYSWDGGSSTFTLNSVVVNTNGGWGLSDNSPGTTLNFTFSGNTFTVNGGDGTVYTKVTGSNSLVGASTFGVTDSPTASGTGAFVFLSNGVYFQMQSENTADAGGGNDGMERGTYSWDEGTSTFTLNSVAVNTNGGWGLSDNSPGTSFGLTISGNTFTVNGGDGTVYTRVSAIPEPSTCAAFAGLGALGLVIWQRRRQTA